MLRTIDLIITVGDQLLPTFIIALYKLKKYPQYHYMKTIIKFIILFLMIASLMYLYYYENTTIIEYDVKQLIIIAFINLLVFIVASRDEIATMVNKIKRTTQENQEEESSSPKLESPLVIDPNSIE